MYSKQLPGVFIQLWKTILSSGTTTDQTPVPMSTFSRKARTITLPDQHFPAASFPSIEATQGPGRRMQISFFFNRSHLHTQPCKAVCLLPHVTISREKPEGSLFPQLDRRIPNSRRVLDPSFWKSYLLRRLQNIQISSHQLGQMTDRRVTSTGSNSSLESSA